MPTTSTEQYLLELTNEARMDPVGSVARYISLYAPLASHRPNVQSALKQFGVDGARLRAAVEALRPVQPLASSEVLAAGARAHNQAMAAADQQSHQAPGELPFATRLVVEGYAYQTAAENVYAYADDMLYAQAGFMVDWGGTPATGGMQAPAGHRSNIMGAFREVGISVLAETDPATAVGPFLVTEDFGARWNSGTFVLGVAYRDSDRDGFYSIGEGLPDLVVQVRGGAAGSAASSGESGGFTLQSALVGTQVVELSGAGLAGTVGVALGFANGVNAKLDVVDGATLRTSVSATVTGPVVRVQALGVQPLTLAAGDGIGRMMEANAGGGQLLGHDGDDTLLGGAGDDTLDGGRGINRLDGGAGHNTAVFGFASTDAVVTWLGHGWRVEAPGVQDVVGNVQHFRFTDIAADRLDSLATHDIQFSDATADTWGSNASQAYGGPVEYLRHQFIWSSANDVAIAAGQPDTFLKGGAGGDALLAAGGRNVLDGGGGSNFLVGGAGANDGADTFFVDGGGGVVTWSSIVNFHRGDQATIWGFKAGLSTRPMSDNEGAAGFTGATIHSELAGAGAGVTASLTFAGIDQATADAHFRYSTGTLAGGVDYLLIEYG